ncbi:MAG TPA: FHA domain-containing protein, partial [Pyrinomonadaceae bacterium]|nr:FHA domain-containing protein [Pyrinomonadaceae bacterium]
MRVTLQIRTPYESRSAEVNGELTLGRTDAADVVLEDAGLSRVNTTFFIDDGTLWVADEDSTNGTFLNGRRIAGRANAVSDGDTLKIGSGTTITVEISDSLIPKTALPTANAVEPVAADPVAGRPNPTPADVGGERGLHWAVAVAA